MACFLAAALFLLQPLYMPRGSGTETEGAASRSNLAETAALNQMARVAMGASELAARYPGAERLMGTLEGSIREGEGEVRTRQGLVLRLIVYDALGMEAAREAMAERLGSADGEEAPVEAAPPSGEPDPLRAIEALYLEGRSLTEAEAEAAEKRYGYVGRLARVADLRVKGESTAELEAEVRASAVRFLIGYGIGLTLGLAGLAAGGLLFLAAVARWWSGSMRVRYIPPTLPDWLHLESFTAYLWLMIAGSLLTERLPRPEGLPLLPAVLLQGALLMMVAYPRLHGADWEEVRNDLGLRGGGKAWREAALGPVGYLGSLPLVAAGMFVTLLLVRWTGQDVSQGMHPIVPMMKGEDASVLNAAMALLVAVVMAPVLEEIMFRGFFYGALRSRFPAWASVALSGAFFAGIHPQGWIGFPMLLAIGVTLAALREWRGSLITPIVAHGCVNGVTMLIVLLAY